jgi:hypothetical protein
MPQTVTHSTPYRMSGDILAMRDIGVDESEELPLILRPLVDDGGGAAVGALTPEPLRAAVLQAVRDATPALMQLQVGPWRVENNGLPLLLLLLWRVYTHLRWHSDDWVPLSPSQSANRYLGWHDGVERQGRQDG